VGFGVAGIVYLLLMKLLPPRAVTPDLESAAGVKL
jgi:hypothetical protein